eukprot:TRINITY_DN8004_c0_g1_i1.p1 TRINITY_DN8004_c0_g1~~TRINITY_DN8004_c0_g1_i1.p1  ORF type:complete len:240 (+),score=47.37 TRINITY_DN8004_c0_g1_i1:102-722(+)
MGFQKRRRMSGTPYKIVMLGAARVGKTSITERYVNGAFSDHQKKTINASFLAKTIALEDKTTVTLNVWDTAGQEMFHALAQMYYRDADAAVIAFDLGDMDTFTTAQKWADELQNFAGTNLPIAIACNKCDLPDRAIPESSISALASTLKAKYFMTSAKTGEGVDETFKWLAGIIYGKKGKSSSTESAGIKIGRDSIGKKKKGGCCQ